MIYFAIFCLVAYELSGDVKDYTATVSTKQIRQLENKPDLFWVEVWIGEIDGVALYNLLVDEASYNRLWQGDKVVFSAKRGRLTGWLYHRKLVA